MALVKIGKAAALLGVEVQTRRKWKESGELIPDRRSKVLPWQPVEKPALARLARAAGNELR